MLAPHVNMALLPIVSICRPDGGLGGVLSIAGTLNGGSHGPLPYTRRTFAWGPAPPETKADVLDVRATNLSAVTIDPRRARVDCNAKVNVTSDGPLVVTLAGCGG